MTREEKIAEDYCNKVECTLCGLDCTERLPCHDWQNRKEDFLAGLEAGKDMAEADLANGVKSEYIHTDNSAVIERLCKENKVREFEGWL